MEEATCQGCEFSHPAHREKIWCELANDFVMNLGNFCPKDKSAETIKESCQYCLLPEKTIEGKESVCSADLLGGGHHPCWVKEFKDLLHDPDFTVKEEVK